MQVEHSGIRLALLLVVWASDGHAQTVGTVVLGSDIADGFYTPTPPFSASTAWLGLYADGGRARLEPVEVEWSSTEHQDYTEHRMSTDLGAPLIFFGDVAELSAGPVETVRGLEGSLSVRGALSELEVVLGDSRYVVRRSGSDPMGCDSRITLTDGTLAQELYIPDPNACGEAHFAVHWAGDLDRDGRIDLVATFSPKYSRHPRQLFLSSVAEPGHLVAQAALDERTAM